MFVFFALSLSSRSSRSMYPASSGVRPELILLLSFARLSSLPSLPFFDPFRYLARHRNAAASFPEVPTLICHIRSIFKTWHDNLLLSPPTFEDSLSRMPTEDRVFILKQLSDQLEALCSTVDRETGRVRAPAGNVVVSSSGSLGEGQIAVLGRVFTGPGGRHDNDHATIDQVRIAPTHEELMSDDVSIFPSFISSLLENLSIGVNPFVISYVSNEQKYLPYNVPLAPHPIKAGRIERVLDTQFRLLREELIVPLQKSLKLIFEDLAASNVATTHIGRLIREKGGVYRRENTRGLIYFVSSLCDH
jgi:hypothetical protein